MPVNPSTLVVVHAYSGDIRQVENNLPMYKHHGCPVVVLSPEDAPIQRVSDPGVTCLMGGKKGWIGPHTLERELTHLRMLLQFPYQYFLLNDADSLCLSSQLPGYLYQDPNIFWSNEVADTNPAPSLLPRFAFQPPYFVSRNTIEGLLRGSENLATSYYYTERPGGPPIPFPTQCIDHYLVQLVHGAGLQHFNFHTGASFETESEHGLETMAWHVRNLGKEMIHSVKSKKALDRLVRERAAYLGA